MFLSVGCRGEVEIFPKLLREEGMIIISYLVGNLDNRHVCVDKQFGRIVHALRGDIRNQGSACFLLKNRQEVRVRIVGFFCEVLNLSCKILRLLNFVHKVGKPSGGSSFIFEM